MKNEEVMKKLKTLLQEKIEFLKQKYNEKENIITQIDLLSELIKYFETDDYSTLMDNSIGIDILFSSVLNLNEYQKVSRNFTKSAMALKTYLGKNRELYLDEIKRNKSNIKSIKSDLINKLIVLKQELSNYNLVNKDLIINFENILKSFEYNCPLTDVELELLSNEIVEKNFELNDQIRIFENIRVFNSNAFNNEERLDNSILKMLDFGFEKNNIVEPQDFNEKKRLDAVAKCYLSEFKNLSKHAEIYKDFINDVNLNNNRYTIESFNYILNFILEEIEQTILQCSRFYDDKSFYLDDDTKKDCLQEFNNNVELYKIIREHLISQTEEYEEKLYQEMLDKGIPGANNLVFAYPGLRSESETSYIEKDLKHIPEENLEIVQRLLYQIKTGVSQSYNTRMTNNENFKGFNRLKDGQVRLIYKHLSDNNYLIMGVGIKKDQNGSRLYSTLVDRNTNVYLNEENNVNFDLDTERKIVNYIKEKKRIKGQKRV